MPTFCFICGLLGHSDKFCSKLFDVADQEIIKPYGPWMRASFKKHVNPIGAKWLRSGNEEDDRNFQSNVFPVVGDSGGVNVATNSERADGKGVKVGREDFQNDQVVTADNMGDNNKSVATFSALNHKPDFVVLENKKRRTDNSLGLNEVGLQTEIGLEFTTEENEVMEHDGDISPLLVTVSKNVLEAGSHGGARLQQ